MSINSHVKVFTLPRPYDIEEVSFEFEELTDASYRCNYHPAEPQELVDRLSSTLDVYADSDLFAAIHAQ
jgi:hypothetical protein